MGDSTPFANTNYNAVIFSNSSPLSYALIIERVKLVWGNFSSSASVGQLSITYGPSILVIFSKSGLIERVEGSPYVHSSALYLRQAFICI